MAKRLSQSSLVPAGFVVVGAWATDGLTTLNIRSTGSTSRCPDCGAASQRVHSHYTRRIFDLPIAGKSVTLRAQVRRFRCEAVLCGRRIFAERFDPAVLAPWARRTGRLEGLVHHLGLALGGRPGASFAKRLVLPVSNDTLLRVVRRRGSPAPPPPTVIGIDDWAWRRNHRYGTIICDLERRRPIGLLPDREPATAQAWLRQQPQIAIVARDRGGAYALAAERALPHAIQVADRWHLLENASRAFLDAVRKSMRQIRSAIGAMTINPNLLSAAERLQYEGYLRREEANAAVFALAKDGVAIKEIVRRTGHSRGLVRQILRGQRGDVFRLRESSLEGYLPWLDVQWSAGRRNGAELWRQLRTQGFRGSLRVVTEWATRRRRADQVNADTLSRIPSARTISRLMTTSRDTLSKAETVTVAAIETGVPALIEAREIIAAFHLMIRRKAEGDLCPWIERGRASLVASFANGVDRDISAVRAAITSGWSNGQTEGQITKLKLVKRQMYGRGKLDLLEARLLGHAI
ncbi:ISL3 family transposase [Phenylobacterium sp.]|uniref:ISL3 family transposase n=1 Tax=Phenylobacterium sp. TaxID=1871053 RepID=UPI0035B33E2C